MSALEKNILATLAWFDIYKYPLTWFEVWQYLWRLENIVETTPVLVYQSLKKLESQGKIKQVNGYWQLNDSADLLPERQIKFINSIKKRQLAKRGAWLVSRMPFVEMVGLGNTLAFDNASADSDIDLLIVIKPGRMFIARFIITAVTQVLGWRRHHKKINNRLCLSFYLTSDNLNFETLAYEQDPYMVYWLATLQVMYDSNSVYYNLLQKNIWLDKYLINWRQIKLNQIKTGTSIDKSAIKKDIFSNTLDVLEEIFKWFQIVKIKSHKKTRLGDGTKAVLVSDKILKFHESDARPILAEKMRQRLESVISRD